MTAPRLSLLCGIPTLGYTDLPLASARRWSHDQHGPKEASFKVPCKPFGALDPRLRRDSRLWLTLGARCVWSGYLGPVSAAQSDGSFVTVNASGTYERGMHDETYVRTCTDADESKWFLRKGSSKRFTLENNGTLLIRAEGGGAAQPTNWREDIWAEWMYYLDSGLGDPTDTISQLAFLWNVDMAADWVAYLQCWSDPYNGVELDGGLLGGRLWRKTGTTASSGEEVTLTCPAGTRAVAFGLRLGVKGQLATDVFAELADMHVIASSGRVRIDEALALVAADLTDGPIVTTPIGDDLDHLVWALGDGSRSYFQEQATSLHNVPCESRYVPPLTAPGEDSFIAGEMPTAPPNRQRWWFVSAKDTGVTCDLTYQDPEGMDVAGVVYARKDGNLVTVPSPTSDVWPDEWTRTSETNVFVASTYDGAALDARSFVVLSDPTERNPDMQSIPFPCVEGAEYGVSAMVERATAAWPEALGYPTDFFLSVDFYDVDDVLLGGMPLGSATYDDLPAQGDTVFVDAGPGFIAVAGSVTARITAAWNDVDAGSGACAVRSIRFDTALPGGSPAVAYHPAAPTSVDQRARLFDYSEQRLSAAGAESVLEHAYAWYGVQASERDREAVGTVAVPANVKTIDGAPGWAGEIQTGDWLTVVDDIDHQNAWPAWIAGVEVSEDGLGAILQLGGDGGDFNYVGRATPPAQQKRKRRRGHHHRVLWRVWAKKHHKPITKKHPKWAPG